MFNYDAVIRRSIELLGAKRAVVAFPYERPRRAGEIMCEEGIISGLIANDADDAATSPYCVGRWTDSARRGLRFDRPLDGPLVIVGVGAGYKIAKGLLRGAFWKGRAERVAATDCTGEIVDDVARWPHDWAFEKERPGAALGLNYEGFVKKADERFLRESGNAMTRQVRRRVLFFIGSLGAGGAERQAAYLARGLAARGYEVHVCCLNLDPPGDFFLKDIEDAGVRAFAMAATPERAPSESVRNLAAEIERECPWSGLSHLVLEAERCATVVRELEPTIVHLWMDYFNALAGMAAAAAGAPRVVMSGRSFAPDNFLLFQPWMRPFYLEHLRKPGFILLNNSEGGARDYERWLGLARGTVKVIRNGFEAPALAQGDLRERVRAELGFAPDDLVAGSLLRFSEEKRPDFLVKAAIAACRREPRARFAFFGDGTMRPPLAAEIAAAGLAAEIVLPGRTSTPINAMAALDVFLLASRLEGLPNVLVEAQLAGVPVLCTGVGGMKETFVEGVTGVVAPGDDATKFADAALSLLRDPERLVRMSAAAKEFAAAHFSIDAMVESMIEAYDLQANMK